MDKRAIFEALLMQYAGSSKPTGAGVRLRAPHGAEKARQRVSVVRR